MTSTDVVDLYVRSSALFGEALSVVTIDLWNEPTLCGDWDIQALAVHVVSGEAQLISLVEDGIFIDQEIASGALGPDPLAVWRGTALKAISLVKKTPLDQSLPHPTMDLTLERLLGARITDNAVHAWDLMKALGKDHVIEDDIAEWLLDYWLPLFDFLAESDHFDSPVTPANDSPSSRLLGLLGRQI